jgi:NAD+ synthase/NAD+ synthase (glutamine-hydrolysing)
MKVALAQINTTVGDFPGNSAKIREFTRRAQQGGAELVVFPELCLCGYPPRDLVDKPSFIERNRTELESLARQLPDVRVICGFVSKAESETGKSACNSAAMLAGGAVQFVQHKMLLPTYDVFDEGRYFHPAQRQDVFELCGHRWALTICEDIWNDKTFWKRRMYVRDPVEEMVQQDATILLTISASPYVVGKRRFRGEMLRTLAQRHGIQVLFCNQVGGNDTLIFDGSSVIYDAEGMVCAQGKSFEEDLIFYDTAARRGDLHEQVQGPDECALRAVVLGTRDYVRKCGFRSVVIGLSGGIDSSLTAALAVEALGKENVLGVAMPGPYSSESSLADAQALADNLGIRMLTLPITEIFETYLETLRPAFAGRAADVSEENIQARIRGNLLMALSNKFGSLVLSTGNKSELAVGYCTLYGDMAGGLAVLSDIPKTMVYRLSALVNRNRPVIPQSVFDKPPSAELRPNQKDSDSLPPYDVLDNILKAYIEDNETPRQIAERCRLDLNLVRGVAARVDGNEYKRQQAAPGLKITSKAFGIGRRFPIAQRYTD